MKKFASIARELGLGIFVEIFEGRLRPEDADLDLVELSAIKHLIAEKVARLGIQFHDLDLARLTLATLSLSRSELQKAESVIGELPQATEDAISRTAGAILHTRNPEVEAKHLEYLRKRTPKSAVEYIRAFAQSDVQSHSDVDSECYPEESPIFCLRRLRFSDRAAAVFSLIELDEELAAQLRRRLCWGLYASRSETASL